MISTLCTRPRFGECFAPPSHSKSSIFLTSPSIANRLAADHTAVLHPDTDSPFASAADAVDRLLPYHIFQHPLEDLIAFTHPNRKGKRKETREDLLREEVAGGYLSLTACATPCLKSSRYQVCLAMFEEEEGAGKAVPRYSNTVWKGSSERRLTWNPNSDLSSSAMHRTTRPTSLRIPFWKRIAQRTLS